MTDGALSDTELERYARHIVLPQVGGAGQRALKRARVAVVGAGGLGSPCLTYLAAAGVGSITVIDDDHVALSNLQRQTLFSTADVGQPKAPLAARRLRALNPHVDVQPVTERLDETNARVLLAGHDVVADGSDRFATRAAVNRAAVALGIPLVSAAIGPFSGQVATFAGHRDDASCWACLAGAARDEPGLTCADQGVLGALAGVIGALQAAEVIRVLTGFAPLAPGTLFLFDLLDLSARRVRVPKDPGCTVCRSPAVATAGGDAAARQGRLA
ncbi:MAG: molybdopterin-synthase adenylyltransferase MoeB [Sphingomonadaceae bacterium]|uniref:HesA/MoeB/ThiF family protein n=1 Tax=Thermaurantiacus sp. TaxID=2820283 RepID=UPI00298F350A|nr:molybdopterin-synthase adenylyltransferase MoeB [Thermaurantiacus sp.]MCS6986892.1 molybdopterin-synthase adenylyltransferase MoeB [Sphingomonadaceae bacterium]MDW8415508.1 molybdopterin-synthase adenylyltransferase MoeB [Thermaurantiacus sp.]